MGAFSYSVTGEVTATGGSKPKVSLDYRVHVFDRYNWDKGKSTRVGPLTIKDEELQKLHRKGLAREYIVRGDSAVQHVDGFVPSKTLPDPGTGGGRDGNRSDPSRNRGGGRSVE
jgi:hypothetical protein